MKLRSNMWQIENVHIFKMFEVVTWLFLALVSMYINWCEI